MYAYNDIDRRIVAERVTQFRDQTRRYLAGELTEDQFRPLRLQNGLYYEKHNPLLRIAIPYGQLSSKQLRTLARITRIYDRGYGHFTTRHNLQLNWVRVDRVPEILAELAEVDMHSIQSCGNCIRVVTADPLAGVSPSEIADPRPWAELFRQWATLHPEFATLPRKFKVAFSGGPDDAASTRIHDLGFEMLKDTAGNPGFRVWAGGGLGRTPILGRMVRDFLPAAELLNYSEALLRVYNLQGRRDNLYKSRLKVLVQSLGAEEFSRRVEAEWTHLRGGPLTLTPERIAAVMAHFAAPAYENLPHCDARFELARRSDKGFAAWVASNVHAHRVPGYAAVTLSLKRPGKAPGDASAQTMEAAADLAERFGFGELRTSQTQNLILPDVKKSDLYNLWQEAKKFGLATATVGLLADVVACPGGDYCSLAYARTLPVVAEIQARFSSQTELADIGPLRLNISGCVNACGHHHVGDIGILGINKAGEEHYQIILGGRSTAPAAIGKVIGPSVSAAEVPEVVARIVAHYRACRYPKENFSDTLRRIGISSFMSAAYAIEEQTFDNEREVANG
ncbi:nitrite/sulfite reductase [Sulfuricystis multivorans]|uniref:nitrite/sulfite reductase n=1 Tax=Sulfuricystis multivorans TaxID=2211108 RepID=UPI000F84CE6F|nr:nitrite/sulfite reductase [Sulfuricystis multivorans]